MANFMLCEFYHNKKEKKLLYTKAWSKNYMWYGKTAQIIKAIQECLNWREYCFSQIIWKQQSSGGERCICPAQPVEAGRGLAAQCGRCLEKGIHVEKGPRLNGAGWYFEISDFILSALEFHSLALPPACVSQVHCQEREVTEQKLGTKDCGRKKKLQVSHLKSNKVIVVWIMIVYIYF